MKSQTVASFYKFICLKDPKKLRELILKKCSFLGLKGTILLASEGVNGMISGDCLAISQLERFLNISLEFNDLDFKISKYDGQAFRRMLVKVKKEIITMGKNDIDPTKETGKYLDPIKLKKWLDDKKDLTILDTRNAYEVSMGSFEGAIDPNINSFKQFTSYIDEHTNELKNKTVVTFCTGGIRCEKATAYMLKKGINSVFQVEGGILKYFEKTKDLGGKNYWNGDCVVFDKRKAVKPDLSVSDKRICYVCLEEIPSHVKDHNIGPGNQESCSPCFNSMKKSHEKRVKIGVKTHEKNMHKRAVYLQEQKAKYIADN